MATGMIYSRDLQLPGRSPAIACQAMAATSHPLATISAVKVLREGGNAVDAAIAASAVLCVVEPHMTGIGGDCFVIVHQPDGSLHGLNGSGRAGAGAELDWYLERKVRDLDDLPVHTITVPGALKAWDTLLARFGTRSFKWLFADAISYAEDGFAVAPRVSRDWASLVAKLSKNAAASSHFLRHGKAPDMAEIFKLPALAKTLRQIASRGVDAFYSGEIAAEIASTVQGEGGFLDEQDLANVSADWVEPISVNYGGYDVHEIPPSGQGIIALVLLKLLWRLKARELPANSIDRAHMEIEAARLAYSVRDAYVADPASMGASSQQILSDQHIGQLAEQFDRTRRNPNIFLPELPGSDTTYLTIVDRDLRAVSFINSLYTGFGSGIVTPKSGICLQNRGACFSLIPGHDNAIGPSKRPMHTIIPGMMTKDGKIAASFGVMGGAYQPMGHAHVLTNLIDHQMDPQQALDHGRIFWNSEGVLEIETSLSQQIFEGLADRGHATSRALAPMGGGQMITVDHKNGTLTGASDPRKDGIAAGY